MNARLERVTRSEEHFKKEKTTKRKQVSSRPPPAAPAPAPDATPPSSATIPPKQGPMSMQDFQKKWNAGEIMPDFSFWKVARLILVLAILVGVPTAWRRAKAWDRRMNAALDNNRRYATKALTGTEAVVLGGTSGIGRALTLRMA